MAIEDKDWKPFFFDGNQAWGFIDSRAEWSSIVQAYKGDIDALRTAKTYSHPTRDVLSFGFRMEHRDLPTLGDWADVNGIDLDTTSWRESLAQFLGTIRDLIWLRS